MPQLKDLTAADKASIEAARQHGNLIAANTLKNITCHAGGFQSSLPVGEPYKPQLQLPVNGVVPDVVTNVQPSVFLKKSRLKCFADPRDAYDSGMFLRAVVSREFRHTIDSVAEDYCQRRGMQVTNAGVEGTGSLGGYTVPAPLESALIDVREKAGVMRSLVRVMPMTSDTLTINKRSSGLTVYVGSENPSSDMTASDKGWQQIELVAKKRYVVHQISQELVDDSLIAIVDDAINEMGYALALKEDDDIVNGTGTGSYGGIQGLLSAIGAAGVHTPTTSTGKSVWSGLTLTEFNATMGLLPDEYGDNPAWLCSNSFYHGVMARLAYAAGGNDRVSVVTGENGQKMFMGYPVFTTNRMPTTTAVSQKSCLFGSFNMGVILGERTGVRIARSDDFAFLRDLTTLKATTRYDAKVHAPGTGSVAGAYVALSTAAS